MTFRPLDASKIRRYLSRVNPLDKAGAYAIQEGGETIVERIEGSYTNVVGLPVERLTMELERWSSLWARAWHRGHNRASAGSARLRAFKPFSARKIIRSKGLGSRCLVLSRPDPRDEGE